MTVRRAASAGGRGAHTGPPPHRWRSREADGSWSLCLPAGWAAIPVADAAGAARAVTSLEAVQLGSGADATVRRRVRGDLLRAARQARSGGGGRLLAVSTATVAGVPVDATLLVHVLPGLGHPGQSRRAALVRLAERLDGGEIAQLPAGPALRTVRETDGTAVTVEYWVAGRARTYHLVLRSSLVALAGPLTALSDAVVETLAEGKPPRGSGRDVAAARDVAGEAVAPPHHRDEGSLGDDRDADDTGGTVHPADAQDAADHEPARPQGRGREHRPDHEHDVAPSLVQAVTDLVQARRGDDERVGQIDLEHHPDQARHPDREDEPPHLRPAADGRRDHR